MTTQRHGEAGRRDRVGIDDESYRKKAGSAHALQGAVESPRAPTANEGAHGSRRLFRPVLIVLASLGLLAAGGGIATATVAHKAPTSALACLDAKGGFVAPVNDSCASGLRTVHISLSTVKGATGARGLSGLPGANGTNGTNGGIGATGATGAQGPAGTNGTNGGIGATGLAGVPGPAGTNGTNGVTGVTGASGPAGPGEQVFSASGSYSYTVPTGVSEIQVEIWGAGGGGGASGNTGTDGGGGGAGGLVTVLIPVTSATSCTGSVGAGGAGGNANGVGGNVGDASSTVCGSTTVTADGGGGGGAGGASVDGVGAVGGGFSAGNGTPLATTDGAFLKAPPGAGVMANAPLLPRPTCMALPAALAQGVVASSGCIGNRV